MKNLKKNNKGFTIIEVLIVLAIAGLIMLVVFLAVPALQRNSRNTQRKSDVSSVLGAVSEYVANNGGALPITGAAGPFATAFTGAVPKTGFYSTPVQVQYVYAATVPALPVVAAGNDTVTVYNFVKCNGNVATLTGASLRSVAALYNVEGSSGNIAQCQES